MAPSARTASWNAGYKAASTDGCALLRNNADRIEITHHKMFPDRPCSTAAVLRELADELQKLTRARST